MSDQHVDGNAAGEGGRGHGLDASDRRTFLIRAGIATGAAMLGSGVTGAGQATAHGGPPTPQCLADLPVEGTGNLTSKIVYDVRRQPLPPTIVVERNVRIPQRDGITLSATVWRPAQPGRYPTITTMTPYGKDNGGQWEIFAAPPTGVVKDYYMGSFEIQDGLAFEAPDALFWVPNGYTVVLVDAPGLGQSDSNPTGSPGPNARWHDIMAWIADQPWSTGNIGMSGVSALAITQYIAAKNAPPQLKAIMPWEGINANGPGGGFGGVPEIAFQQFARNFAAVNPNARGPEPGEPQNIDAISVPMLVCASFSDHVLHTFDSFEVFLRAASQDKYLFNHRRRKWEAFYGSEERDVQRRFFDRYLKGDAKALKGTPPVRLEVNEDRFNYKVMHAEKWPVEGTRYIPLYLDTCKLELAERPLRMEGPTRTFAPQPEGDARNRVVFDYRFSRDTDVVGYMGLKLWVEAADADDLDLFVGVEKLDRHGDQVYFFATSGGDANGPASRGWLRVSTRQLDPVLSTPWRPVRIKPATRQPLSPGQIVPCEIAIMPSGTTFRRGERLRLVVQSWSSWDNLEEITDWGNLQQGRAIIHCGGDYDSRLLMPVIPEGRGTSVVAPSSERRR